MSDDEIPGFLRITPEARKAAWVKFDAAHAAQSKASPMENEAMKTGPKTENLKVLKAKRVDRKPDTPATVEAKAKKAKAVMTGLAASLLSDTADTTKSAAAAPVASATANPDAADAAATGPKAEQESAMKSATQTKPTKRSVSEAATNLRKAKATKNGSKKKAAANARKPVKSTEPKQPYGMAEKIGKLASRAQGASRAELIELSGWKQQAWKWYFVNSKDSGFCQRFGYKLEVIEGKDGESRYKITPKK